jgi:hypothetical protein
MTIKDSGKRIELPGMVRDVADDKMRYDLALDGPMFKRWVEHLTAGAKKYAARNWMGAYSEEERQRFRESALRHFIQWFSGEVDEDHAAAVFFNINGAEYVAGRMDVPTPAADKRSVGSIGHRVGPADRRKCLDKIVARKAGYRRETSGRRMDDADHPFEVCGE